MDDRDEARRLREHATIVTVLFTIPPEQTAGRTVLAPISEDALPLFTGKGRHHYYCQCGAHLVAGIGRESVPQIVIQCPRCGAVNEMP